MTVSLRRQRFVDKRFRKYRTRIRQMDDRGTQAGGRRPGRGVNAAKSRGGRNWNYPAGGPCRGYIETLFSRCSPAPVRNLDMNSNRFPNSRRRLHGETIEVAIGFSDGCEVRLG
jgi:hypothetical protein